MVIVKSEVDEKVALGNVGWCDEHETLKAVENIRREYLDAMIDILEEDMINDNK